VTTLADATFLIGPTHRLFINVGLLGAYTTFERKYWKRIHLNDRFGVSKRFWFASRPLPVARNS